MSLHPPQCRWKWVWCSMSAVGGTRNQIYRVSTTTWNWHRAETCVAGGAGWYLELFQDGWVFPSLFCVITETTLNLPIYVCMLSVYAQIVYWFNFVDTCFCIKFLKRPLYIMYILPFEIINIQMCESLVWSVVCPFADWLLPKLGTRGCTPFVLDFISWEQVRLFHPEDGWRCVVGSSLL